MIKTIKIPEERVGVLIGVHGKVRKDLEKLTNTKIIISDEIIIYGEPLDIMTAENIIKAVGRGFSPKNAFDLLDEENTMAVMQLPKNESTCRRMRSRLIGTKGKCRRNVEMLTKTKISIYGKTVSIIGKYEDAEVAEDAISRLMKGLSHSSVYEYLERKGR